MASNLLNEILLCDANNDLAIRLYPQFSKKGGNVLFSPFAVCAALSVLMKGTKAETEREIREVLFFESIRVSSEGVFEAFERLIPEMTQVNETFSLRLANGIVSRKSTPLSSDFVSGIKKIFQAEAYEFDFQKDLEIAISKINEWVKDRTYGSIPFVLDSLDSLTVAVLVSATYFKGYWNYTFNQAVMKKFFNNGVESEAKEIPTMSVEERFMFMETSEYKAMELPYKHCGFCHLIMLLLLPVARDGLAEVEKKLSVEFLKTLRKGMHKIKVALSLPKFTLGETVPIKTVCKDLGLNAVFQSGANFEGMSSSEFLITEILHKPMIEVTEEGSETTLPRKAEAEITSVEDIPEFTVDHPFTFVVFNRISEMIFFMGRVQEL